MENIVVDISSSIPGKILALELWAKMLLANQIEELFKK